MDFGREPLKQVQVILGLTQLSMEEKIKIGTRFIMLKKNPVCK